MSWFLKAVNLERFFPPEKALPVINGKTKRNKTEILRKYIEGKRISDIVIIGDSIGDLELAWLAGGLTYLYAHPGRDFPIIESNTIPDYKINDLREVLKSLEKIF